jgi:hypothetical protein
MKKKTVYILLAMFALGWFSFWGFRNSHGGAAHTSADLLSLSAPKVIWEIQKINPSPDEAWKYIEEKGYHYLLLDDDHYYALDVFGCDDEWFIVAVPSVKSRYIQSPLARLLFLDFSEVNYPIFLGVENKYYHVIEDPMLIDEFKSTENKCTVIDSLDLGAKYTYAD